MRVKIIVDGNSVGYAAHNARELTQNGRQVQAIFFTLKMLKKVVEKFASANELVVLWDMPAKWRYEIHPEYKGKRDDDPVKKASRKAYKEQVPGIRKALSLLGLTQIIAKNEEADDIGAAIALNREPDDVIILVSGDRDWLQLVGPNVVWYDPREEGKLIKHSTFEASTGCANTVLFSQAKAVLGDSSDNIGGIGGVGEKCLELLFEHYGSIPKFLKAESEGVDRPAELNRWRKKLDEFDVELFKRNMQLMNLLSKRHRSTEILDKLVRSQSPMDIEGFVDFCHEHAFISIARAAIEWEATFKKFTITR